MDQEANTTSEQITQRLHQANLMLRQGIPNIAQEVSALIAAYQQPHRYYHDLEHIATLMVPLRECGDPEIADALGLENVPTRDNYFNALKVWAALGHDCIYRSADEQQNPCHKYLTPFLSDSTLSGTELLVPDKIQNDEDRRLMRMVRRMFGIEDEVTDISDTKGINEFLSALVTAKAMQEAGISEKEIAVVICAINATCPFLPQEDYIKIRNRLTLVNEELQLGMIPEEQQDIVTFATHFSNEDVKNFRGDPEPFMRNGYKITAEFNAELRGKSPSPDSFLRILQKERRNAVTFYENRENILHHNGQGYPSDILMQNHVQKIAENTEISRKYQEAKIVATTYIHAKAKLSERETEVMRDLIPEHDFPETENHALSEDPVFSLLRGNSDKKLFTKNKAGDEVLYDLGESPLTCCLYSHMGAEKCETLYQSIQGYVEQVTPSGPQHSVSLVSAKEQCTSLISKYKEALGGNLLSEIDKRIMPEHGKNSHVKAG